MKITSTQILIFVAIVVLALLVTKCNDTPQTIFSKSSYDSLMHAHVQLNKTLDSLSKEIKKTDTIIIQKEHYIYVKGKNTISLDANQSIRLFNEWTRHMHDSLTRLGYLRPVSDTFNQVR